MLTTTDVNGHPYNRLLLVITLLIGTFTTFLTQTILTTAYPTLMADFHISASAVQWLTTGFMLIMGIMIPVSAWLLDKFNVKYLYLTAMTIFFLGSLICWLAPDFQVLLAGRLTQAIGVGMSMPTFQTVMFTIFPPGKRGSAMGLAGIVIGLAPAIGPTLSGWILLNHTWRALFAVIMPIAAGVVLLAIYSMRKVLPTSNPKIDIPSIIASTLGFGGLLYGFSTVGDAGWTDSQVLISLAIGIIFVALFCVRQLRLETPLLELRVFKSRTYTLSVILTAVAFMSMVGVEMVLPMYIQTIRGESAFHSGMILFPGAIMMGIMSPITGRIFDKIGAKRLAVAGLFLLVAGSLPLVTLTANTPIIYITTIYTVRMFGITMVTMPVTTAGMNALPTHLINHGTAVNNTVRQVAASIGTAILVSVLSVVTKDATPAASGRLLDPIHYTNAMNNAVIAGYRAAFAVSLVMAALGLVLSLFLKTDVIDRRDASMIILLLIVGALAFFWAVVLMQPSRRRQLTIWVSAGLVLAPILLLSVNDLYHVGFNIDETTELQPLAPMDDQLQISRRPIGTAKKHFSYRYLIISDATVHTATPSTTVSTRIEHGTIPQVAVTTQKLTYSNALTAILFAGSGEQGKAIGKIYTFTLPANWQIVDQ